MGHREHITRAELDGMVGELARIERASGWQRVLSIGEFVLNRFFLGDPELWCSRRRDKAQSIRRLAEHPGCPLRKTALAEAVAVFVLQRRYPEIADSSHLTPGHAAAVLGLDETTQKQLLQLAEQQQLSTRELRGRAAVWRAPTKRRGRPPVPGSRKAITRLTTAIVALEEARELVEASHDLEGPARSHLLQHLTDCVERMQALERLCQDGGQTASSLVPRRCAEAAAA